MKLLDMIFRRKEPEGEPVVPDRSEEIETLKDRHVDAVYGTVRAGVLSQGDYRVRRAIEATGRAVRVQHR